MTLPEEQIKQIKEQILNQVDSWQVPSEQKNKAKEQIEAMNSEQLEEFLIKNNLIQSDSAPTIPSPSDPIPSLESSVSSQTQCPFCLIVESKIPSYKLDENKAAVAVLEINPLSEGHTIIIPKKHTSTDKISSQALTLAKKIAKKLKSKLKPTTVEISSSNIAGHSIINVLPMYKDKKPEKTSASKEELEKLQKKLEKKVKPKIIRNKIRKQKVLPKAPKRIP